MLPVPEPDDQIVGRLAEIAGEDVGTAIKILGSMVRKDKEGWHVHGWMESAKRILALALTASEPIREEAIQLINFLGRRGYVEFGTLLHPGAQG